MWPDVSIGICGKNFKFIDCIDFKITLHTCRIRHKLIKFCQKVPHGIL
jgi:hypothetical protein